MPDEKTISQLLQAVEEAKKAFDKAKTEYDKAKTDLATSPKLKEFGLQVMQDGNEPVARRTRKTYPELSIDAVKSAIKDKGGKMGAGELREHFGPSFAKWMGDAKNIKAFNITKEGTSKTWTAK
jgi:hypothetical protein